jgi:hypothetical protein
MDEGASAEFLAEIQAPYKNYNERLGAFMVSFSATEKILLEVIKLAADLDSSVGNAVLGGVRVHDGTSMLNRVLDALSLNEKKAALKPALDQLGQINTTRNNILHWGAQIDGADTDQTFLVTNAHLIHERQIPIAYTVTPSDLSAMIVDLSRIQLHLVNVLENGNNGDVTFGMSDPIIQRALKKPWLYKPPQRAAPPTRNADKPPRPPRQPKASQKSRKAEE